MINMRSTCLKNSNKNFVFDGRNLSRKCSLNIHVYIENVSRYAVVTESNGSHYACWEI